MGIGQYILSDTDNTPVRCDDTETWGKWMEKSNERRRVGRDVVVPGDKDTQVMVSTVFLGLDHSFPTYDGPEPILFETLVFAPDGHPMKDEMRRYRTWAEAFAGHYEITQQCEAAKGKQ